MFIVFFCFLFPYTQTQTHIKNPNSISPFYPWLFGTFKLAGRQPTASPSKVSSGLFPEFCILTFRYLWLPINFLDTPPPQIKTILNLVEQHQAFIKLYFLLIIDAERLLTLAAFKSCIWERGCSVDSWRMPLSPRLACALIFVVLIASSIESLTRMSWRIRGLIFSVFYFFLKDTNRLWPCTLRAMLLVLYY